ncbi:unnamed protein product [Trypanosoma congolense IL3000]|uniref:WGS project CAEQ00000000 data, annotated contig 1273 n=1 Tax=Trypanosoma congolense (strain IL3000) TaxID=1068625 RepID=F9W543_TRYCI|nr:unnamed protein product [Trypanosoma congolense IL3000]
MPRELAALIYFLHLQPLDWHSGQPKHHAGRFGGVHNFSHLPRSRISRAGKVLLSFSIGTPHPNEELVTCKGLRQISRHFLLMSREAASDSDVTVWQPLSPSCFRLFAFGALRALGASPTPFRVSVSEVQRRQKRCSLGSFHWDVPRSLQQKAPQWQGGEIWRPFDWFS